MVIVDGLYHHGTTSKYFMEKVRKWRDLFEVKKNKQKNNGAEAVPQKIYILDKFIGLKQTFT